MSSVSNDQAERERRADAILDQIPQADLEALMDVLARLAISVARNESQRDADEAES